MPAPEPSSLADAVARVDALAAGDDAVLLVGEPGTRTEALARHLHRLSDRRDGPFVVVRCALLRETQPGHGQVNQSLLLEELFGSVRGSFIGRSSETRGALGDAAHGTLLLDGAHAMSPVMQVHLLRCMLDGSHRPIGADQDRPLEARLLFTSSVPLPPLVERGDFRADLCARLLPRSLALPPLRDRADIPALVDHLRTACLSRELRTLFAPDQAPAFSPAALDAAARQPWPGHLDELETAVLRALSLAAPGQTLGPGHLLDASTDSPLPSLSRGLERALSGLPASGAERFVDQANAALVAFSQTRHQFWNSRHPPEAPSYPRLPLPDASLAPAVACLLRLDRLRPDPRWRLLHDEGLWHHFFPLTEVAPLLGAPG